ncbi:MAG TPA: efflux RND transporter periplasmic adaptor subunit [Rhizomicrobium sp.]|nr:efflux RND transporter periplasmic adaptor subunit [Rhizomicrobium sp.]
MSPQNDPDLARQLKRSGIIAGTVLGAIILVGTGVRLVEADQLKTWTRDAEVPTVSLISPKAGGKDQTLSLPGSLAAWYDARIYARVPGYVKAWYKDIGAHVKQGELLALIDTPELDQQIAQARADLDAAQSAEKLSAATARRWNSLLPLDAVSRQDAEEKNQEMASKAGAAKAAKANLDRLLAMKSFARITAPFDGVVTRRTADIGQLVTTSSSGDPLFAVADMHAIRVYVNVPQAYSAQIVPGMTVSLSVPEYPGRTFPARLVGTSGAISSQNASLQVEFDADNRNGLLKPGAFAQVDMSLPAGSAALRLPASALMFRSAGLQVATVGPDDRVTMKPISIGTDLGAQVIVASGLKASDRVVDNPPDSLSSGDQVRVMHVD